MKEIHLQMFIELVNLLNSSGLDPDVDKYPLIIDYTAPLVSFVCEAFDGRILTISTQVLITLYPLYNLFFAGLGRSSLRLRDANACCYHYRHQLIHRHRLVSKAPENPN